MTGFTIFGAKNWSDRVPNAAQVKEDEPVLVI
jgi:hypothetical protein